MGKAKKVHVTQCEKHGRLSSNDFRWWGKQVIVPPPESRRLRNHGGCPTCRAETNAN